MSLFFKIEIILMILVRMESLEYLGVDEIELIR